MFANRAFGYCRVSDKDQNMARQIAAMRQANLDDRYIFTDKQSGKDFDRPYYQILKKALRPGDLLIILSIDRLGRNYREIINEWREITQELKADIKVLDMPMLDTSLHKDLLGTFISDLILQVLAYVAEQERVNIKQRQDQGIAAAKLKGKHLGRPKAVYPEKFDEVYVKWKDNKVTAKEAIVELKLKTTTFYKLVRQYEAKKGE